MPSMPRIDKKANKIAFDLIGKPANLHRKSRKKQAKINEQLLRQETTRIK